MERTVVGEIINCDNLYIAKIIQDDETAFITGTPEYLAPLGEVKEDPKATNSSSAYDGAIMFNYFSEGAGETSLTVPGLSERRAAEITGKSYDATKGIVFDSGDLSHVPSYAIGFRVEIGSADGSSYSKYRWFLKGNFMLSATTAKTKGEKVDGQAQEVTYLPVRTIHKWSVPDPRDTLKSILTGLKVTKTDTTDPAFKNESTWFSQVQTPDTITPAPAVTLTSVPANNATAIVASTKPTLTFNNAIDTETITLIKATDNSIVTVSKAFDATRKVLTLIPSANLTAAGVYTIVVSGVKDVYGQTLATSVIKFTVA